MVYSKKMQRTGLSVWTCSQSFIQILACDPTMLTCIHAGSGDLLCWVSVNYWSDNGNGTFCRFQAGGLQEHAQPEQHAHDLYRQPLRRTCALAVCASTVCTLAVSGASAIASVCGQTESMQHAYRVSS